MTVLLLSACSAGVVIHDGEQDMLVGSERVKAGCYVNVAENYTGVVDYSSDTCSVVVNKGE